MRQGRCAAVLVLQSALAVLPAVETDALEAQLAVGSVCRPAGGLPATVTSSYLVQLGKLGVREVRPSAGGTGRSASTHAPPAPGPNLANILAHMRQMACRAGLARGTGHRQAW